MTILLKEGTTIVAINNSDHPEFEALVKRTERKAYTIAYRLTGNRDDAQDLTQEACLRAYRSFDKYNRSLPFENWFLRILSNLFIDVLRRRPKQKPLSLDQPVHDKNGDENAFLQIAGKETDPESHLLTHVISEEVAVAIQALPEHYRTAIVLYYI